MNDIKLFGKKFYDFLKTNITPLLKEKAIIFLRDNQGFSINDNYAVKFIYTNKLDKRKQITSSFLNIFKRYDNNHFFIICSLFPDNETYFEFNKQNKLNYELIVHVNIKSCNEIQKELCRSCKLFVCNIPWDETTNSQISWKNKNDLRDLKFYIVNPQTKEKIYIS